MSTAPTPQPPGRNIVICCDGTWNSPEEENFGLPTPTNVYKLFRACMDEAESQGAQITWYQPGVGSNGSRLRKAFEGATGTGIGQAIKRGYHTIAAHYRGPQDRIFLIGFSRGAFVARSIAGMIQKVGLLQPHATRQQVEAAYELYRKSANEQAARSQRGEGPYVVEPVRVQAIGVWDTVGALGLSLWGWSFNFRLLWQNKFHRLSPNLITDHVFHALAVDEKRTSFMPVLWHLPEDPQSIPTGHRPDEVPPRPQVEQVWFRGAHSDVGGGYADTSLSDIALGWMMDKLASQGLLLRAHPPARRPDPCGRIHLSERAPIGKLAPTWPRWFPLVTAAEVASGLPPSPLGVLHDSVATREVTGPVVGLLDRPRRRLQVGESARVLVRAREPWEYTGVVLSPGARYQIQAQGLWQSEDDEPVGPQGQARATESCRQRGSRWRRRHTGAPRMALIAYPGRDFGWKWRELGLRHALAYWCLRDPLVFTRQLQAVSQLPQGVLSGPATGDAMLWCFANEARGQYDNNTGSVQLTVTRLS